MYKDKKNGRCICLRHNKKNNTIKKEHNGPLTPLSNIATGFIWLFLKLCVFVYRFIKYVCYGLLWPFIFIIVFIANSLFKPKEINVEKLREEGQKLKEKEDKKEKKSRRREKIDTSAYKNENIVLEKKSLGYYINAGLTSIILIPKKIKEKINVIEKNGFVNLPICVAKTQYSFSDNPKILGSPTNFDMKINDVRLSSGAGFIVVLMGNIMTLPGLAKNSAYLNMNIDGNNNISGLF